MDILKCGLAIFLLLLFYMKSILAISEGQKLPFGNFKGLGF